MFVEAKSDIVTPKGFTVAMAGDRGLAAHNCKPHDANNYGKVLVFFGNRDHGYWVNPEQLQFIDSTPKDIEDCISKRVPADPYAGIPDIPASKQTYEYHFGKNLQLCRKARKLSQAGLGESMGKHGLKLAQSTICYREQAKHSPSGKFIEAASKALQVPAFVFFVPLHDKDIFCTAKKFLCGMSVSIHDEVSPAKK